MNKNHGTFGLGKQTAAGSPAAPTVTVLASADSEGIDASTSTDSVSLTNGKRDTTAGRYISGSEATAKLTTLAFADFIGMALFGALGSDSVSGESAPYTHDIKMGESLPYLTFVQQVGASDAALQQLEGCKVDSLSISAEGTKPPSVEIALRGCAASWLAAKAWNGPAFDASKGWFKTAGAEVLFSPTTNEPAAVPPSIDLSSLSFKVENAVEASVPLGQIAPKRQTEKSATVTVELSGTTDSTEMYRLVKTGSSSGTSVADSIVVGSLQVKFKHTVHEDWSLTVKMGAIPWKVNAMGVSTDGGPFDLTLSTDGAISVGGTSIEAILVNDTASY
ncbi:hypothetical protein [Paraeggerthella sp.]|uniref:hypothetical protein n=1 Tax=Paraeggerthella sp. TaxID=2897350 RepID=UPI003AB2DB15